MLPLYWSTLACLRWIERHRTQFPSELERGGNEVGDNGIDDDVDDGDDHNNEEEDGDVFEEEVIKMMTMMIITMTRIMRIIRMMTMVRLRWMERFSYGFPQNCGKDDVIDVIDDDMM